jgi:DNA polymerase
MMSEMPKKYWKNLPEAAVIPQLIQQAESQKSGFMSAPGTQPHKLTKKITPDVFAFRPTPQTIETLQDAKAAAARCTACTIHHCATQTIFGEGPKSADLMLVGEQPGDQEDLMGSPFIGPAGQLLDTALMNAGIDRHKIYVTNAVKHFKFKPRGKRRIHQNPTRDEIERCRNWLDLERQFVRPRVILALGRSALYALTGYKGSLKSIEGRSFQGTHGETILATFHPSFLLRLKDKRQRQAAIQKFVDDIAHAHSLAAAARMGKKEAKEKFGESRHHVTNALAENI